MKSISPSKSFRFQYISVVEESDNSNSSSDSYDGSEESVSPSGFIKYSAKENQPQVTSGNSTFMGGKVYNKTNEEYHRRRERNNLAVRKSRDKARQKQKESLVRLQELTAENKRLQMKAELLMKELVVLKGLFPSIGEIPPPEVDEFLAE